MSDKSENGYLILVEKLQEKYRELTGYRQDIRWNSIKEKPLKPIGGILTIHHGKPSASQKVSMFEKEMPGSEPES